MRTQAEKGVLFRALHERERAFVIPNPWDVGTARLLARLADVLYAPGLTSKDDNAAVVRSVERPVNVIMGLQGVQLDLATLAGLGVKRVSVGSALSRTALGAFLRAAREMQEHGTFNFAAQAVGFNEVSAMFGSDA